MSDHPTPADFNSFLQGVASAEVAQSVVRHLLAACSRCRALLQTMGWSRDRLEHLVSLMASDPEELLESAADVQGYDYDETFKRVEQVWARGPRPQQLLDDCEDTVAQLEELPISAEDSIPEPALIKAILERSHAARYQDPERMLYWAGLARALAERCKASAAGGETALADLRSRAWGQLGNALRVAGRLRDAETALNTAERHRSQGSGGKVLEIELLGWQASLYTFQRRFGEALSSLNRAEVLSNQSENRAALAKCLVQQAIVRVVSAQPNDAIVLLDRAIPLIDATDKRLLFAAHHNLIHCYTEVGRLQEALALFPQTQHLAEEIQDELLKLRLLWQEGKILFELDLLEDAEAQFCRVRDGFSGRDLAYAAAVVSLDLTAVYIRLGLRIQARRTIADILPIFSSLRVGREVLSSLIQLQQAEDQTQALQLIRALSRELVAGPKLPPSV